MASYFKARTRRARVSGRRTSRARASSRRHPRATRCGGRFPIRRITRDVPSSKVHRAASHRPDVSAAIRNASKTAQRAKPADGSPRSSRGSAYCATKISCCICRCATRTYTDHAARCLRAGTTAQAEGVVMHTDISIAPAAARLPARRRTRPPGTRGNSCCASSRSIQASRRRSRVASRAGIRRSARGSLRPGNRPPQFQVIAADAPALPDRLTPGLSTTAGSRRTRCARRWGALAAIRRAPPKSFRSFTRRRKLWKFR